MSFFITRLPRHPCPLLAFPTKEGSTTGPWAAEEDSRGDATRTGIQIWCERNLSIQTSVISTKPCKLRSLCSDRNRFLFLLFMESIVRQC